MPPVSLLLSFADHRLFAAPRKRRVVARLGLFLAICSALWVPFLTKPVSATPLDARERDLTHIEQEMRTAREGLAKRERQRDELEHELERSERDIAALARAGHQLAGMLAEQRQALDRLNEQLAQARNELAAARARLAELLRAAYAMGRGDRLRILLDRQDRDRAGRLFGYYRALGQERTRRVETVERHAAALRELADRAASETERLTHLAQEQENTHTRLSAAQRDRAAILADLQQVIAADRDRVAQLTADAEALRRLIEDAGWHEAIRDELDVRQEPLRARKGRLRWPVPNARLVAARHAGARRALHGQGVLLATAPGSEVFAVHHGQVVFADWLRGFGLLLIIDHGDGDLSLYGHNQSLLKEPGEWVAAGEVIALAGDTGGQHSAGLYFALRHRGRPVDPRDWCSPIGG